MPPSPPFSPSLISLMVSVDVKHHVYLLTDGSRVPGEIKRSRDLRGGTRGGAGPSLLPRRDHELGGGAGLSKLDVFCFELSKLFVNSGATDIVLVTLSSTAVERAIAQCTSRWAMARGHRLNTSIVLAAVYGLSPVFFGRLPRSSQSPSVPFPLCPRP